MNGSTGVKSALPLRAALLMAASSSLFGMMAIAIRYASHQQHPFEIAFFRCLFGALFALPLLRVHGLAVEADAGIRAYHGALPQMFALSASPAAERLRLAASAVSSAAELSARVAELLGDHDGRVTKPDRS